MPIEGDEASLRAALLLMSDIAYKKAIGDYQKKKILQATAVETEKDNKVEDFSRENSNVFIGTVKEVSFDRNAWRNIINKVTGSLTARLEILEPRMDFEAERIVNYYVNTEGTILRTSEVFYRIELQAWTRTPDGMEVSNFRHFLPVTQKNSQV